MTAKAPGESRQDSMRGLWCGSGASGRRGRKATLARQRREAKKKARRAADRAGD